MPQNALAAREHMRRPLAVAADDRHRPSPFPTIAVPVQPLRRIPSNHLDLLDRCDTEAGVGFPGILLPKSGGTEDHPVLSSPSFFCGSPPNRVANPVIFDSRFGQDRPPVPVPAIHSSLSSPIPARKGYPSAEFSYEPAMVRVEGFDCLNRDGRRCNSITAVA